MEGKKGKILLGSFYAGIIAKQLHRPSDTNRGKITAQARANQP